MKDHKSHLQSFLLQKFGYNTMDKSRFSMLLLEPGEIYFEDYSCIINNSESLNEGDSRQGRLKLCSKSLVFEPREWSYPLIKLHFRDCLNISVIHPQTTESPQNVIMIEIKQYAEMLEENVLAPYKFRYEGSTFYIFFDFASADETVCQMHQLQRASTLNAPEHNSMVATILHSRYMRMVFDPVMMDDFTEEIVCELQAEKISPLVRHQGKLALTPTTLYFQPFSNVESSPILKLKLSHLKKLYKRRFLLRQVGLEIYSVEESAVAHIYLTFQSEDDRDRIYDILEHSPSVCLEKIHAQETTLQWQNGVVSNYDYLMHLNCLADRSKNDLTQYRVFPWVISDYTSPDLDLDNVDVFRDLSKPMGALNPDRLEKLKERYHEMSDPKFMYGSHYSAPGLVLFYLVRKYPEYMLCLQNGRFDHPDRMFNSVKDVYNNCLRNMSDFKELVPEFYDIDAKGDFLVNKYQINFGDRHDGTKVNNVALPPWADTPENFVIKLREALESEYVSRHLHLWIDLIFGYKQRGEEAIKANNVFHHVCYEGSVDLDDIYDMNDRHALEVQIMEFGQVPKQLFVKPHVRRVTHQIPKCIQGDLDENGALYNVECSDTIQLHKEEVTCALRQGSRVISVGKDGTLKVYDTILKKQIRSVILSATPLSSCVMMDENIVAAGSWDNEIYLYDVDYGRVVESFRAHDDCVSCLLWLDKERLLISGGYDGVVRAWGNAGRTGQALRGLRAELDHDGRICAITYKRRRHDVDVIAGTSDGEVFVWSLAARALRSKVAAHAGGVAALCVLPGGERVASAGADGALGVTDLGVCDSVRTSKVAAHAGGVAALCVLPGGERVASAGADGALGVTDLGVCDSVRTSKVAAHAGGVAALCVLPGGERVASAGADGALGVTDLGVCDSVRTSKVAAHAGGVAALCVLPGGERVASAGADGALGVTDLGVCDSVRTSKVAAHAGGVAALCVLPGGERVASAGADGALGVTDLGVCDSVRTSKVAAHAGGVAALCVLPGGERVASAGADGALGVTDLGVCDSVRTSKVAAHAGGVAALCVLPGGERVASAGADGALGVTDLGVCDSVRTSKVAAHAGGVAALCVLPGGERVASAGADGALGVTDLGVCDSVRTSKVAAHAGGVAALCVLPGGERVASAGADGALGVTDLGVCDSVRTSKVAAHAGGVAALCVLPGGERVASAGADGALGVTDLGVCDSVYHKQLSEGAAALCRQGARVLWLGGRGGALMQWDARRAEQTARQPAHHDVINCVYFDEGTNTLVTASKDKTVKVWKLISRS